MERDANGLVRGFAYHDGYLDGIVLKGRAAELAIRSIDDERRTIALHGLRDLKLDNFRQGNIIRELQWLTVAEAVQRPDVASRLAELGELARELFVFVLDSSYGADLIAVCERAEVSDVLG